MIKFNRIVYPACCPVCRIADKKTTVIMKSIEDLSRNNYICGFCGSFFW